MPPGGEARLNEHLCSATGGDKEEFVDLIEILFSVHK